MMKRDQKGFVSGNAFLGLVILGLLMAVVIYALLAAQKNGRDAQRVTDMKRLSLILNLEHDAVGSYPAELSTSTLGSFTVAIPQDPQGSAYSYAGLGGDRCDQYHLGAIMEVNTDVLINDADALPQQECNGSAPDFSGLSAGYGAPPICEASSSAPFPNGGERCFDIEK